MDTISRPLSVLLFSSSNSEATFLAAGLLYQRTDAVWPVLIQGTGDAALGPDVLTVLAEEGSVVAGWVPPVVDVPPTAGVDVGLTICVPT